MKIKYYLIIFVVALSTRLSYFASRWKMLPDWHVDALGYQQLALNLLTRGVFSMSMHPPYQPDIIRTPGYPIFIVTIYTLFGVIPKAVLVIQAAIDSFTALIVMNISLEISDSKESALVAGMLYAFSQSAWRYSAEFYVETLLAFLVAFAFYVASKMRKGGQRLMLKSLLLGIIVGSSVLVKPSVILLPLVLGGVLLARALWKEIVVYTVILIVTLSPWIIRNTLVFGHPTLSMVFSNNLARVSAPATLAAVHGESITPWSPRWENYFFQIVEKASVRKPALFAIPTEDLTPRQIYQVQKELASVALTVIFSHRKAFLISHFKGVLRGWLPQAHGFWFEQLSNQKWSDVFPNGIISQIIDEGVFSIPPLALVLFVVSIGFWVGGFITALLGAWRLIHLDRIMSIVVIVFILYVTMLPGPIAYIRFRIPVLPLIIVLEATGVTFIGHNLFG